MRIRIRLHPDADLDSDFIYLMRIRMQIRIHNTALYINKNRLMMYIGEHYTVLTRSTATHINKYSLQREKKGEEKEKRKIFQIKIH
jgi:hypothetical protein